MNNNLLIELDELDKLNKLDELDELDDLKMIPSNKYKHNYNTNNLPNGLEYLNLRIDDKIQQSMSNLPISLKKIKIAFDCNIIHQDLLSYLPENLKILELIFWNSCTNINLNDLPNGLEELILIGNCNGNLNNLPKKLKILHLPLQVNNKNIFYDNLQNITFELEELKISLESLFLKKNMNALQKLKKLILDNIDINYISNLKINKKSSFDMKLIPNSVEELELGDKFNQIIDYLPSNLKVLNIGSLFNYKIDHKILPDTVEKIFFGYCYNRSLFEYPSNLKTLKFGRNFSCNLINLPNKLVSLEMGEKFNAKLKLPQSLEILNFSEYGEFSYDLELPDSIKIIKLPREYNNKLANIPKSLKLIKLSKSNEKIVDLLMESNYPGMIVYY